MSAMDVNRFEQSACKFAPKLLRENNQAAANVVARPASLS